LQKGRSKLYELTIDKPETAEVQESYFKITGVDLGLTEPQEAMFYYFKRSGKYYSEGRGYIPATNDVWSRSELLAFNDFKMPGLGGPGDSFRIVVIPDDRAEFGWPQIKEPIDA
jgi:hypothetical protein